MSEQGSQEWLAERAGRVTASALSNVMMAKTAAGYQNYMAQLVCERLTGQPVETFKSAAMEHGNDTEPQARAFYELETGNEVTEVGFIAHPVIEWSGASPDGLIGDDGLVEIKCPQPAKHIGARSAGRETDDHVLRAGQGQHLLLEHLLEGEVIGDGRENRGVSCEGEPRQRTAFDAKTIHQLRG